MNYIDREECLQCGACLDECPFGAITEDDDGNFNLDDEICQQNGGFEGCGLCLGVCAVDAIKFKEV